MAARTLFTSDEVTSDSPCSFKQVFYDFVWTLAYSFSRLPSTCSTQGLDGLILNSVTVCMATDKFNQFAVVRRRQTCFASIYCITSPISVTVLVFPMTSKFIIFIQKKTTFAFITQNFHVNCQCPYNIFMLFYQLFFLRFGILCNAPNMERRFTI